LAVNTLLPLSEDVSSTVRIGVLEGLGEVLYTFHEDEENVPQELLDLFKGRRDTRENRIEEIDVRIQQVESDDRLPEYPAWDFGFSHEDYGEPTTIWNDPARPLICAFNYPAVALTLGKERWAELRELYADLAKDPQVKVRRTLAASLGELAKIIGPENAKRDLMDVFRSSITAEEGEVRCKAVEASEVFVTAVSEDDRSLVVDLLIQAWKGDQLKGWREREGVIRLLAFLVEMDKDILLSPQELNRRIQILNSMMLKGLQDDVSSVRDTAVSVIPVIARTWRSRRPQALKQLLADIRIMATDDKYSRRMVFVACQQQLLLEGDVDPTVPDPEFWEPLERLASDHIIGVRIGVARLLSRICGE
jgi:serine/threonine-protein phosphatase 4 regulatory subunit 1